MQFEELLKTDLDDMTDEEVNEIARAMDLNTLKSIEKKIKKTKVAKKKQIRSREKARSKIDDLIAKGLDSDS